MSKKSWIKPVFEWDDEEGRLALMLNADCTGLVECLAQGYLSFPLCTPEAPEASFLLAGSGLLAKLYYGLDALNPPEDWCRRENRLAAHLHSVFFCSDDERLAIILSLRPLRQGTKLSWSQLQDVSRIAWQDFLKDVDEYEKAQAGIRLADQERLDSIDDPEEREATEHRIIVGHAMRPDSKPITPTLDQIVSLEALKDMLPPVVWASGGNSGQELSLVALQDAIEDSSIDASRDGRYKALCVVNDAGLAGVLLTCEPRGLLPSFPEIRAALSKVLPSAYVQPLQDTIEPPSFPLDAVDSVDLPEADVSVLDQDRDRAEIAALHDWRLKDIAAHAAQGREIIKAGGFEAVGWYQYFHSWTEETWGIYLHAGRLYKLACGLHEDLLRYKEKAPVLAGFLAVGLVYRHECFHAKVEACATWLELLSQEPRYRPYHADVYLAQQGTEAWLEEVLANWNSFAWLDECLPKWADQGLVRNPDAAKKVVSDWLDLSPDGYRDWRQGQALKAWRTLSSEIATTRVGGKCQGRPLPTESLLTGELPFEWLEADVPTRFVGHNSLSDLFYSTPPRREAERLLEHRRYVLDTKRGKGSHELWCGPDGRNFPLSRRDPLSRDVFHKLLHHFDLTKQEYVNRVRAEL